MCSTADAKREGGAGSEACATAKTITNRFIAFIFSLMRYVTKDEEAEGTCVCV